MWVHLGKLLLTVGYGVASAAIPVLNAEAPILAVRVTHILNPVEAALAISVGQTIGKITMFCLVRYRPGFRERHQHGSKEPKERNLHSRWGRFRSRLDVWSARLLDLLSHDRWGALVILLSGFVGIPPLYLVALVAGASRMRLPVFAVTVLVSRSARFVLLALGIGAIHWESLWHSIF